jgi:hypothetical protein
MHIPASYDILQPFSSPATSYGGAFECATAHHDTRCCYPPAFPTGYTGPEPFVDGFVVSTLLDTLSARILTYHNDIHTSAIRNSFNKSDNGGQQY